MNKSVLGIVRYDKHTFCFIKLEDGGTFCIDKHIYNIPDIDSLLKELEYCEYSFAHEGILYKGTIDQGQFLSAIVCDPQSHNNELFFDELSNHKYKTSIFDILNNYDNNTHKHRPDINSVYKRSLI